MSRIFLQAGSKRLRLYSRYYTRCPSDAIGLSINHAATSLITKKPSRTSRSSSGYADSVAAAAPPLPRQQMFTSVRFFAAPTSAKKLERNVEKVNRINEEITAPYVRLVTDEGHGIITGIAALQRAKTLDLDLVEVDCKSEPPVCKIIDFHKEKYQKKIRDKAVAKSKAETTLRKNECKMVRFSEKIEQKDLKIKAETVKRLMEHGYRVKVIAEAGKKSDMLDAERQDLGIVLDRLYNLIEDYSAVEGPRRVEKGIAYIIVRHAKFGTKKNPAKKISKSDKSGNGIEIPIDSTSTGECHDADLIVETSRQSNHALENLEYFYPNSCSKESGSVNFHKLKAPVASEVDLAMNQRYPSYPPTVDTTNSRLDSRENQIHRTVSSDPSTVRLEPSTAPSNRYKSSDAHTRLNSGRVPVRPPSDRNEHRGQLDKQCQPPDHPNTKGDSRSQYSPKEKQMHGEFDFRQRQPFPGRLNSRVSFPSRIPPVNNQKYPQLDSKKQQGIPCSPSVVPSSFGVFSASKAADIGEHKRQSEVNNDNRENTLNLRKTEGEAPRQEDKIDRRWGIFSR